SPAEQKFRYRDIRIYRWIFGYDEPGRGLGVKKCTGLPIFFAHLFVNMEKFNIINTTEQTTSQIYQWTFELAKSAGIQDKVSHILTSAFLLISAFILLALIDFFMKKFFYSIVTRLIKKTKSNWDNYLLDNKVQVHVSRLILIAISQQLLPSVFIGFPSF